MQPLAALNCCAKFLLIPQCLLNGLLWGSWPINYQVIDEDTSMEVSPNLVKSAVSSLKIGNAKSKSDIASHWLPIDATLTIMDPNQPEPVMKSKNSIE